MITKPIRLAILLGTLLVLSFAFFNYMLTQAHAATSVTGRKIVIDAGHGGSDPGAVNQDLKESDVALDIANKLKAKLEADGAIVGMTRDCDCDRSNNDRYTYANNFGGEILVSIHLNGSTNSNTDYTLGLYGKRGKDYQVTDVIHQALVSQLGIADNGLTNFASGTLLKSNMPATIQETVFITSSTEYQLLKAGTRQDQIAEGLYQGINNFFLLPSPSPKGRGH